MMMMVLKGLRSLATRATANHFAHLCPSRSVFMISRKNYIHLGKWASFGDYRKLENYLKRDPMPDIAHSNCLSRCSGSKSDGRRRDIVATT